MKGTVDLSTRVGDVVLRSPIMTAAGTAGHGDELAGYGELDRLGAVVVKSLAAFAWQGNPSPRVAPEGDAMLNAVGLSGPGVSAWRERDLPALVDKGATVVASIWGRSPKEFEDAATQLAGANISAVEVNASCPNLESRSSIFAHSADMTVSLVHAAAAAGVPRWVKLSPNTPDLVEIARAAVDAGVEALVLTNTLLGMTIDVESARPVLGNIGGGVSGPTVFPVALRAVYECRAALPDIPIIGVGGIASARDVVAMLMAGANAVEIGTATFADPRAPWRITKDVERFMRRHATTKVTDFVGRAHGN